MKLNEMEFELTYFEAVVQPLRHGDILSDGSRINFISSLYILWSNVCVFKDISFKKTKIKNTVLSSLPKLEKLDGLFRFFFLKISKLKGDNSRNYENDSHCLNSQLIRIHGVKETEKKEREKEE